MRESDKIDHLLRRTGFGVTPLERKRAHRQGYRETVREIVRSLCSYRLAEEPPDTPVPPVVIPVTLLTFGRGVQWWLRTMTQTTSPLSERLTLFWHRHFATSGQKVFRPGWMFQQNKAFRTHGTGAFTELLGEMVEDPALLLWLDAHNNPAETPNENFARELLELFSLGAGNYTERDVKQLAKLTTGKRVVFGGRIADEPKGEYAGPVEVLGHKGQLKLKAMAQKLAVHPATAKRLVRHLWDDLAAGPLPEPEHERLQQLWLESRGNITVTVREILLSPHFFEAPRQRVVSPVEYWVTCSRLLGRADYELDDVGFLEQAGEQLFFPPSVKGWDLGTAQIHPAALYTRLEIAHRVVSRLPDDHFALKGLQQSPDPSRYLSYLSGGQIQTTTLPKNLADYEPREALLLALASPDMWTS